MRFAFLVGLMLSSSVMAQEVSRPEQYVADGAVLVFDRGCIKYYPNPVAFEDWVSGNHLEAIPPEYAQGLVQEPGGKAYSVNNHGVRYALVAEATNLCTVFVKEVNLGYARAALAKVRNRLVKRGLKEVAKVDRKHFDKGEVTTTNYEYRDAAGRWAWTLVVSESSSSAGFFQLAMSAQGARRASKASKSAGTGGPRP